MVIIADTNLNMRSLSFKEPSEYGDELSQKQEVESPGNG